MRARPAALAPLLLVPCLALPARAPAEVFAIERFEAEGRTVAADFVDLDGDGRTDLFQTVFVSFPPNEERWVHVYRQRPDGRLPTEPSLTWRLPPGCAAYDLGDVDPAPGVELVLLRVSGVLVVSLAGADAQVREVVVPDLPTLAAGQDEVGLDRARIVWQGLGPEPWLLLPLPGQLLALSPDGQVLARLQVETRANYLVPQRPGPLFVQGELQVFLDVPDVAVGDLDGDGRLDVTASSRHDLRIFRQREDGAFPRVPDEVIALERVTPEDHLRGSGAVRVQLADLNGDGLADAVVSQASGSLTDARSVTTVHINRGDGLDLSRADQTLESRSAWTANQLVDLDGDSRPELVRIRVPITRWEVVEMLITQAVDAEISVHKAAPDGTFDERPWARRKLGIPFSLDSGRPKGFVPTVNGDFNGDGALDFLFSGGGEHVEVFLGGPQYRFQKRHVRQELRSQGRVRLGDLNGDGLDDFLLYSPRRLGAPLIVAINQGGFPGTPPGATSSE